MADCINPRWVKQIDAFTGKTRMVQIRCGKCANCIAAEQDAWSVRISESCKHSKDFIYTTLTLAPEFFRDPEHNIDISDVLLNPEFVFREDTLSLVSYWGGQIGPYRVPCFDKNVLSAWIKRGREAYFRDTGKRLRFKYLFTSEMGPAHSRPHAHGIIIGLSCDVYRRYFAEPWAKAFGFYDLQYICRNPRYLSSCVNVAHYISKYINKGAFESPLIKDGLIPKCWRMVSNGIGEELLDDDKYKFFQDERFKKMAERCERFELPIKSIKTWCGKPRRDTLRVWTSDPSRFISSVCSSPLSFAGISSSRLKTLCLYVDDNSYYHALPRYYRDRLLGRNPNLFKFAIQTALLQDAEQRYNSQLQALASSLERAGKGAECSTDEWGSVSNFLIHMAGYILATTRKNKAIREEQRYFTKMKNHYNRPKRYRGRSVVLNQ